jgi:hypothetical protein
MPPHPILVCAVGNPYSGRKAPALPCRGDGGTGPLDHTRRCHGSRCPLRRRKARAAVAAAARGYTAAAAPPLPGPQTTVLGCQAPCAVHTHKRSAHPVHYRNAKCAEAPREGPHRGCAPPPRCAHTARRSTRLFLRRRFLRLFRLLLCRRRAARARPPPARTKVSPVGGSRRPPRRRARSPGACEGATRSPSAAIFCPYSYKNCPW